MAVNSNSITQSDYSGENINMHENVQMSWEIIYFAKHEQTCNDKRVILYKESKMYYKYNWACVVSIKTWKNEQDKWFLIHH